MGFFGNDIVLEVGYVRDVPTDTGGVDRYMARLTGAGVETSSGDFVCELGHGDCVEGDGTSPAGWGGHGNRGGGEGEEKGFDLHVELRIGGEGLQVPAEGQEM